MGAFYKNDKEWNQDEKSCHKTLANEYLPQRGTVAAIP
jgi:hypothetical protein